MKKHKVAIYIRVSTKKQVEEGYSLEAQQDRLIKLCETNGYIVYKIYADEGKSGKDTNRPAFQDMMTDMRNREFDKILVMKLDRISRSVIDLELMIKEMQKYNVEFESASEKIDTSTSFGMMFIRLLAIFAQFERERIKERVTDAFEQMVTEGKPITGEQPIGYKIDNGKVVIDENEKQIVNYFFDTYEKYHSLRKASIYTNEKFGLTKHWRNYAKMIEQTRYYGSYKGNDNYCPPYMTKERWDKLREIRKSKNVKVYSINRTYIFSGLLVDTNCGNKLTGNHIGSNREKEYYTYRCKKANDTELCIAKNHVNEKKLEKFLVDNLNTYINDYFKTLELEYGKYKDKYKDNTKRIADIKAEMERTTNSYNKGRMTEEKYDKDYEKLEKELAMLEKEPVKKDTKKLKDLTNIDWETMYHGLTRENKQAFWRNFIEKIEIDPIHYKEGMKYIKIFFI